MKERITKFTIALLSVIMVCLLAVPASADYDFDGFEVNDMTNGTVQGDVFVSYGDKGGIDNTPYTTNYNVPNGTNVKWARLIVGIWGGTENKTGWVNMTFNNHCEGYVTLNRSIDTDTYSTGTNVYCSGHGVWMVSYNCTDNVTLGATNTAVARTGSLSGGFDTRVYGIALVVVYENSSLPKVQYWINEGNMNLHYETGGYAAVNKTFAWFNGTAHNCTEANLTTLQYTGSNAEPDYLYFNVPDENNSPYNDNVSWNLDDYRTYQMDHNNVADCYSGLTYTHYFDLDTFHSANDSTPICNITNHTANNYAIFWRGHDDNGDGTISASFQPDNPVEGESYVHPIMAVLRLQCEHIYDFSTGAGTDKWAYEGQVSSKPPSAANDPSGTTVTYTNIEADDGTYETYVTTSNGNYAAQRFNFSIDETAPEKINVTWNGKGWHDSGAGYHGAKLYIWNFTSAAYEQLDSNSVSTDETLTGAVTSNIVNYINTGNVTVLVEQNSAQTSDGFGTYYRSHIETDYVKLVVTP